jgi:Holliday junction DNA helicase RuvA
VIGSLRGVVLEVLEGPVLLVEVGGVGYRVNVPATALPSVSLGGPVFLHVHTYVREDAIVLYGFPDRETRGCFEVLIGTHGIGPGLALAILSVHSPAALRRAVLGGDVDALTLVPGVGRKTAARLLMELETRLGGQADGGADGGLAPVLAGAGGGPLPEVRAALAGLGYGPEEVRVALRGLPAEGTVEDLLRAALRELAGAQ